MIIRLDPVADTDPLGPSIPFVAEEDGAHLAAAELMARSWMGDETGRLVKLRWQPGHREAGRKVLEAVIAAAEPGQVLNTSINAEIHSDPADRIELLESCGFELWQEKEGFWWADEGQELSLPQGITIRRLADVGADRFAELMADCTQGSLDRIDNDAVTTMGPTRWATEFLAAFSGSTWLLAEDTATGQAVGYVSVGEFEPGVGTITYIGVAPEHRGRGHVDALLKVANRTARELGFHAILSDTDTLNVPMQEAFRRNGHSSKATGWHKWMHRLTV